MNCEAVHGYVLHIAVVCIIVGGLVYIPTCPLSTKKIRFAFVHVHACMHAVARLQPPLHTIYCTFCKLGSIIKPRLSDPRLSEISIIRTVNGEGRQPPNGER